MSVISLVMSLISMGGGLSGEIRQLMSQDMVNTFIAGRMV